MTTLDKDYTAGTTCVQPSGDIPELTYIERVIEFLRAHEGCWCDSCINTSTGMGSPGRVNQITRKLGMVWRYYHRSSYTECEGCGKRRKCISLPGS